MMRIDMHISFMPFSDKQRVRGAGKGGTKMRWHLGSDCGCIPELEGIIKLRSLVQISCVVSLLSF